MNKVSEKKQTRLTELQLVILEIINNHIGREEKISRHQLRKDLYWRGFSISDRAMRENIEYLRMNVPGGAYICSTTSGGYWRAKDLDELLQYIEQDEGRAKMILARTRRQKQRATRAMTLTTLPINKR
jgi:hypothetical protein